MAAWPPTAACNDCFRVGDVDAVARDLVAVHVNQQGRLAEFLHDGEFREARHLRETPLDFERLFLENVQIGTINFYRERAFQSGERFVHCVFSGLRVVENDAGKCLEVILDVFGQLRFVVDRSLFPRGIVIGFQANVKLIVKEAGGIGAVVGAAKFRTDVGDHRILQQNDCGPAG